MGRRFLQFVAWGTVGVKKKSQLANLSLGPLDKQQCNDVRKNTQEEEQVGDEKISL